MTDTASPPGSRRWLMLPVVLLAMFISRERTAGEVLALLAGTDAAL